MDRRQQDALYEEANNLYRRLLGRLARAYDADPDRRSDLLQEIHVELWRSMVSFDHRCSLRTWVYRVVHNIGASHVIRRRRVTERLVGLETLDEQVAAVDGMEQIWLRLALAWMALLTALSFPGTVRIGARRIQAGESCAQFMVRELEGSRRTLLSIRWGMVLVLPSLLMFWWGAYRTLQASGLALADASVWRHSLLTLVWSILASLLILFACWVFLGLEARKRARQAEELRRAIEVPE